MTMPIKALTFDTGGTILDWHHGLSRAFAAAGARHGLQADWATLTNAYRRRSLQAMLNAEHPTFNIDDVHRQMLDTMVAESGLEAFTAPLPHGSPWSPARFSWSPATTSTSWP